MHAPAGWQRGVSVDPYCGVRQLPPLDFVAMDGHTETLTPWQGGHVAVLVEPGVARDRGVMERFVGALDRAWSYYAQSTGRLPAKNVYSLNGRDEIAEVSGATIPCVGVAAAACSVFGQDGTEDANPYFEYAYNELAQHNLYDQALFYELGRSFWFWSPQLASGLYANAAVTGFAVWMRFRSMAAAGVNGAPFAALTFNGSVVEGTPFSVFESEDNSLAGEYEANPSLTFAGTLAQDKSPNPSFGSGTDFWASLMTQLAARHGGDTFVRRFWQYASQQPAANSVVKAVTNWERAASDAACTDLSSVFYTRWGFPRPDGSVTPRPAAATVPEPTGHCATG